jgi:serine/threonine protein phosphatase PrpC
MEDAYTAVPFLLELPRQTQLEEIVPPRINAHVRSISGVLPDQHSRDNRSRLTSLPAYLSGAAVRNGLLEESSAPEMDALHFFGVFDGHGGSEAALHCARTLHERLSEALSSAARVVSQRPVSLPAGMRLASFESHAESSRASIMALADASTASSMADAGGGDQAPHAAAARDPAEDAALDGVHHQDRDGAHSDSSEGSRHGGARSEAGYSTSSDMEGVDQSGASASGVAAPFTAAAFEAAFTDAFVRVDEELAQATDAAQVGTTAVVALVGDRQLYIGNCGACCARCATV